MSCRRSKHRQRTSCGSDRGEGDRVDHMKGLGNIFVVGRFVYETNLSVVYIEIESGEHSSEISRRISQVESWRQFTI